MALLVGMKVRYLPQPEWGVGHLRGLADGGSKAEVEFPAREGPIWVSTKQGALVPCALVPGDRIRSAKGTLGNVTAEVEGGRGLRRYELRYDDGRDDELPETELRSLPPQPDLLASLREGRVADSRSFLLRRMGLTLDDERRCDALGALLASRVMVKPHQVGVVQRVLSSRRPRFILADEVGLGKTIEAGMIFSALRLAGLGQRVLVVAPSHLTVQWLVELFHKFNQLFTLMDAERYQQSLKAHPDESPWVRFPHVVTSLELLVRTRELALEAGKKDAFWDLVIIDEAHHLKAQGAFEAARALALNTWGLLLLTATPMQLDPAEYHRLLTLIDPDSAPTREGFEARLARQEDLSASVRAVLAGKTKGAAALAKAFPEDKKLATLGKEALLEHLAESYSLSHRLLRNRRSVVGGFAARKLHRHAVKPSKDELASREAYLAQVKASSLKGAALADAVRRLDSSSAATGQTTGRGAKDAKFAAFLGVLKDIWAREPGAKVLAFTESRATLDWLQETLRAERIEALGYHGDLPLVDRDRQVARFRDPDGPRVLLSTEVGGEGRNFQFSHHLVHYDLPWSPAAVEQRIGRLDRIGQSHPVQIHVFDVEGTVSQFVLDLLDRAVGVFGETVGGLDAVLEEVEPKLSELALQSPRERVKYAEALASRVAQAREQVRAAYDPLLDLRSFDRGQVQALLDRAHERLDIEADEADSLEEGLWAVARDLDERLEEVVTELARKVGLGVDTDEHVDAFQCAFHFGHALSVEALPGLDISQERTVLGTFWRDTAVEQEEIEYFATGHPIVEALFGFLKDGPYGRNGFRYLEKRGPLRAKGLEVLFHVVPPEADDTAPGARVPSRQLARFVDSWLLRQVVVQDARGAPVCDDSLRSVLDEDGRTLRTDEIFAAFPGFERFVDPAIQCATASAEAAKTETQRRAKAAIAAEREQVLERLTLGLRHQGVDAQKVDRQLAGERAHYQALMDAADRLTLVLDSACGFVVNR